MLFDRHVVVDWSASATPKSGADSIWIADLRPTGSVARVNPTTRLAAEALLTEIIAESEGERLLIGVDASLGYPRGTAAHFGLSGDPPWRAMWDMVSRLSVDDARNRNNRFDVAAALNARAGPLPGPFWGCPSDAFGPAITRTKPATSDVAEFREVERRLRSGGRFPKSAWQLLGAGSVGGQTLTLIPLLWRLLEHVDVWPFTTGLEAPSADAQVVVAEVWPSMFTTRIPIGLVPDAAQVTATAEALCAADGSGDLARWFAPDIGDPTPIETEEGWILGSGVGQNPPS